ncbi:hypothetical protein BEL04_00065 [Mucilaginibacter sp. PPCGB 2223]|uniref:SMEK domain-containing protein n=1 Tax=Mucilaginibacter sp. PPCGB 2223 TaxID=1886027 RepID=UPI000826109B|nr:SMEK domain-containing protein [Mucilaginibacter sp. PPCGB 2223]OCX52769.1 hypothetical protein BEL04_00065 [Mucilaginibacter sp. PPCGB 2223]
MNRIDHINKITTYAARFVLEVEGFNANSQYHINIHAESFLIPVLNETFGLELENLNSTQKKNYPAIDLADFKNRVAFQVTATSDFEKIKNTLESFFKYKLNEQFDVLYIYIITHKKENYNATKLRAIMPGDFVFDVNENIIDKDDLLKKINAISSTPKLQAIAKLYEHEFSDVQIQTRQQKFVSGYLSTENEPILPNLLRITFPEKFYTASLKIDEQAVIADINDFLQKNNKRQVKSLKKGKLIKHAMRMAGIKSDEWIPHENRIYTFLDLTKSSEALRGIIDTTTIIDIDSEAYYEASEDNKRVFKHLLRNTLIAYCKLKLIEWFGPREIFRFANNQKVPNQKRVKWKGKKEATKTVIFEMINKKEQHIICYRNLAFRSSFLDLGNEWFLVINPTWSFTNPGGYKESRFEADYMSGLKRMENNGAVCNYFRFFSYYFTYVDLFTTEYPYLKLHAVEPLTISPRLEEGTWNPPKLATKKGKTMEVELQIDNELSDNTLFE